MKRFFSEDINTETALLKDKEAAHCIKVLRCQVGDILEIVDGKGNLFTGELSHFNKSEVTIAKLKKAEEKSHPPLLKIACCIPKNASRWEWFLEKTTEIGVETIIPLIAKRSEKKNIRRDRNEQIIRSAFKQSGQLFLPNLLEPIKFDKFLPSINEEQKFIAHCEKEEKVFLGNRYHKNKPALILIGPEGDFTKEEIDVALQYNFLPVSLGNNRLRVETAGVVAAEIISCINSLS